MHIFCGATLWLAREKEGKADQNAGDRANVKRGAPSIFGPKQSELRVRDVKLVLNQRLNAKEDISVNVVEEIEQREQGKRQPWTQVLLVHIAFSVFRYLSCWFADAAIAPRPSC